MVWGKGTDGGQWEVEDGQNGREKQEEVRWQVVEEKDGGEMEEG